MNILPKKRWHVRTKDNIARVRRDEQKAADEEQDRQRRIALAEQESRTNLLRKQARDRVKDLDSGDLSSVFGEQVTVKEERPEEHINIFKDAEEGKSTALVNKDHEEEKKAETEKYEKSIGYLTYLGQSAAESQHVQPWYTLSHEKRKEVPSSSGLVLQEPSKNTDQKIKDFYDPLNSMKVHLSKKKGAEQLALPASKRPPSPPINSDSKKKRDDGKTVSKAKTIEDLRAERLQREAAARQKTKQLLSAKSGIPEIRKDQPIERQQKYNSQFNPNLARQNQNFERRDYV